MTPDELRKRADELDELARAAFKRGDEAEAMKLVRGSWLARDAADEREQALSRLPRRVNKRTVNSVQTSEHRVAISKARAPKKNKVAAAARESKMSLRELARKARVSPALLSMAASGKRSLKREVAERIQALTGYSIDNWPKLS